MGPSSLAGRVGISPSPALTHLLVEELTEGEHPAPPTALARLVEGEQGVVLGVEELSWISQHLSSSPGMGSLLLSSSLRLPSLVVADRSEELEKRCVKLRAEQQERDYRRMTDNVRRDNERNKEEEPIKKQLKEVNGFLLLILQFVVSVVCAFMFGYMGPYILYGREDVGGRLLLGILAGFVVGCADMYFVIRQLLEEDGIKLKKLD